MPRTYEVHIVDEDDPVVVDKVTEEGPGVRFTDQDGNQVFLPWRRVDAVVSYRTPDDVPAEADEDGTYVLEPGPNAVTPPASTEEKPPSAAKASKATKRSAAGSESPVDPNASTAKEWANADPADVRAWAKEQGKDVSDSGPLPKDVLTAYAAAHS